MVEGFETPFSRLLLLRRLPSVRGGIGSDDLRAFRLLLALRLRRRQVVRVLVELVLLVEHLHLQLVDVEAVGRGAYLGLLVLVLRDWRRSGNPAPGKLPDIPVRFLVQRQGQQTLAGDDLL